MYPVTVQAIAEQRNESMREEAAAWRRAGEGRSWPARPRRAARRIRAAGRGLAWWSLRDPGTA
jgi:hypothetical protein